MAPPVVVVVVVVVVVDGAPQLTNTPPHYRSPLSSFEAWPELFSHHPPFVPGTGGGRKIGDGTDKQTDLDPSCVTHMMKDQRQTDEAANGLLRCACKRYVVVPKERRAEIVAAAAVLSPVPPPSKSSTSRKGQLSG